MQSRSLKLVSWSMIGAAVVAVACAGEEESGTGTSTGGKGGTGATSSTGGASGTGFGGASAGSAGTVGTGGTGGASTGGTGGTSTAGTGGTSAGGTGGTGVAGDCSVGGAAGAYDDVIHVEASLNGAKVTDNPGATIYLYNGSGSALDLSDITLRYYVLSEFPCDEPYTTNLYYFQFNDPYIDPLDSLLHIAFQAVGPNGDGCDGYFEISFDASTGALAPGQVAQLGFGSTPPNNNYSIVANQLNDYSYGACSSETVVWEKIPVYDGGTLVWGTEPDFGGAGGAGGAGGGSANGGVGGA